MLNFRPSTPEIAATIWAASARWVPSGGRSTSWTRLGANGAMFHDGAECRLLEPATPNPASPADPGRHPGPHQSSLGEASWGEPPACPNLCLDPPSALPRAWPPDADHCRKSIHRAAWGRSEARKLRSSAPTARSQTTRVEADVQLRLGAGPPTGNQLIDFGWSARRVCEIPEVPNVRSCFDARVFGIRSVWSANRCRCCQDAPPTQPSRAWGSLAFPVLAMSYLPSMRTFQEARRALEEDGHI